jgi:hypothetical protein
MKTGQGLKALGTTLVFAVNMKDRAPIVHNTRLVPFVLVLASAFTASSSNAFGQSVAETCGGNLSNDTVNCADDRPCVNHLYQAGGTVNVGWDGHQNFDAYNLRWSVPGYNADQVELPGGNSGTYQIKNVDPCTTYTVTVQGCNKRFLASSQCTPWGEGAMTTAGASGPDSCRRGYVWRDAFPGDHVCVTPDTRAQAAADNAQAAARRDPNGAYGPDSCLQGFVWREASPQDHVCVTPDARAQAADDNKAKCSRLCR